MQRDPRKYLYDIIQACKLLTEFAEGKEFSDYEADAMFRAAVEREFEIIGEALSLLARTNPDIAEKIPEYKKVIAFRNILIHAYTRIDNLIVWEILQTKLPSVHEQAENVLAYLTKDK